MGRKIPSKKHRGVKDPLVQQARRLQSLKGKINAPPKDPEEQPIPRSLTQLFAFQNKDQSRSKSTKKKNHSREDGGGEPSAGRNPVASLKKLPGESGRGFSLRINSAMKALHDPMEQLDYPSLQHDMEEADAKGERMHAQRERRRRKQRPAGTEPETRPARAQRLKLKRQAKQQAAEEARRPELRYERVQFGEVAHAPPALSAPRRAPPPQPAGGRGLLLAPLLAGGGGGADSERLRLGVVAAYRDLKKQRRLQEAQARRRKPPRKSAS